MGGDFIGSQALTLLHSTDRTETENTSRQEVERTDTMGKQLNELGVGSGTKLQPSSTTTKTWINNLSNGAGTVASYTAGAAELRKERC